MKRDTLATIIANGSPAFRAANSPGRGDAHKADHKKRARQHVSKRADKRQDVSQRYYITIHCYRVTLADPDGIYTKAAIDGLVQGGALVDDSFKYVVCSPAVYQIKVDSVADEKTVVVLDREE